MKTVILHPEHQSLNCQSPCLEHLDELIGSRMMQNLFLKHFRIHGGGVQEFAALGPQIIVMIVMVIRILILILILIKRLIVN